MAHVLTTDEKITQRKPGQWSRTFLAVPEYHVIYTARLNGIPTDNDMVAEITFDAGSGTLGNVLADMTLYIGTTGTGTGAYDLGMCRVRKAPISGTFYVGETAEIAWVDDAYLTVVDDYQIWQKSLRIVSEAQFMDWDVAYSDQHASFDPVPAMGTHRVAKLTGASVEVTLGPATDTPAWVIGSSISSRLWSVTGATLDSASAVNPVATFTAPGTYLAYCTFTAANGKTFRGIRYVIIYDGGNPLIGDFVLSDGRFSSETGGGSFGASLYNVTDMDVANLRKRSLVILCTEDYNEDGAVTMPHPIIGAENIITCGYISDIVNGRDSEKGDITITVESPEYWLRQIRDFPSGLELKIGTAAVWTDMPSLNVQRALWHFLHWRSTATRVMDVQITSDSRLATRFQTARANLWERIIQVSQPSIYARPIVDPYGRLFVEIEPQMEADADRMFPVVMTITDDDIEGDIRWIRKDVETLSMLFWSGISVNTSGGASSYFSISPGHSYGHYGDEESQDNYLVGSQAKSNSMCGCYYGWKNNLIPDIEIRFKHSFRMPVPSIRQYYYFEISAGDDPRGIGFAGNLIPREWAFEIDPDTGFITTTGLFEPESAIGLSINGDVPTMEDIDFSFPDLPILPSLPALPLIPIPSDIINTNQPNTVVITTNQGVFYSITFDESTPTWLAMNNGFAEDDATEIANIEICPNGAIYVITRNNTGWEKIYRASGLGGEWIDVFDASVYGGTTPRISGLGVSKDHDELVAINVGNSHVDFGTLDTHKIYISDGSGFTPGGYIRHKFVDRYTAIIYSRGVWYVFGSLPTGIGGSLAKTRFWVYTANGGLLSNQDGVDWGTGAGAGAGSSYANGIAKPLNWGNGVEGYNLINDLLGTSQTHVTDSIDPSGLQAIAMSPDGIYGMGISGWTASPYKTTDGGASWQSVGGVIPIGSDVWENCRDNNRFLFGGGIILRLTMDQGNTYIEKAGNLSIVAPLVDVIGIRYIS